MYYMHERFSEIIAFPPLPVAFDFEIWMRASGLLTILEKDVQPRSALPGCGHFFSFAAGGAGSTSSSSFPVASLLNVGSILMRPAPVFPNICSYWS